MLCMQGLPGSYKVSYLCPTFLLYLSVYAEQLSCEIISLDCTVMFKETNHQSNLSDGALHLCTFECCLQVMAGKQTLLHCRN